MLRKILFSERQLQAGSFCWRGGKILEGCVRHFYKLYSYSRKALSKGVRDQVTPDKPTGNSASMGKQTRLSGSGGSGELLIVQSHTVQCKLAAVR